MATARNISSSQILEITECVICTESFKEPKVLPCIHTFCLQCIEKYGEEKEKDPGDNFSCPLCTKQFIIPQGGFKDLPNNYFIIQLMQLGQSSGSESADQRIVCDWCSDLAEKLPADVYCIKCQQHLCQPCCARHAKQKRNASHHVVDLKDKPSAAELIKTATSCCKKHMSREIEFYCYDCKAVACVVCYVDHKVNQHKCSDVQESAEEFRIQLTDDINRVTPYILRNQNEMKHLEEIREKLKNTVDVRMAEIAKRYDQLKSLLDLGRDQLTTELVTFQSKTSKELNTRKEEIDRQVVILETYKRYCEEMKDKGTCCEISRTASDLHIQADQLVKDQVELVRTPLTSVYVQFTWSEQAAPGKAINLIGTLTFKKIPYACEKIDCISKVNEDPDQSSGDFSLEDQEELEKAFHAGGMEGGMQCLTQQASRWKTIPVNIAVIGMCGAGKSTFINAIRDAKPKDKDYAAVGITLITTEVKEYEHPKNPLIKLWDVPGVGTESFPQHSYLRQINIDQFDCFVLLTTERFCVLDAWLCQEIKKRKRGIYVVRTKMGNTIRDDKMVTKENHNPDVVLEKIRKEVTSTLEEINVQAPVFLIDSREKSKYDFDKLNMKIINDLSGNQHMVMLLSMSARSKSMVEAKMVVLRRRVSKTALKAAGMNAILIIEIIEREADFCFKQLGLDDVSLQKRSFDLNYSYSMLIDVIKKTFPDGRINEDYIRFLIEENPAGQAAVKEKKIFKWMPFVGAFASRKSIHYILSILLDKMEAVALEIAEIMLKNLQA